MSGSVVLIDGEHYPPVTARAIQALKSEGADIRAALLVGGTEKLDGSIEVGVPVVTAEDPERALTRLLDDHPGAEVVDLSDEPVLGNTERSRLASITLWKGSRYRGPGFAFEPPPRPKLAGAPSVAVIGSGKRSGKTAISAAAARRFQTEGHRPVIVAMGRGGPEHPEVIRDPTSVDTEVLIAWAEEGKHAASDYVEDAVMARVPTVGAWRAGGGFAGAVAATNFEEAVREAQALDPGLLILEGSGAAIPPCHSDATILVVDARVPPEYLCGYFGLYRLLLADLVVLTIGGEPLPRSSIDAVEECIRNRPLEEPRVVRTQLHPYPLGEVSEKRVWVVTTAPEGAGQAIKEHLEMNWGSSVQGISHSLSDRESLRRELKSLPPVDEILVELKAAAVDVVVRFGRDHGVPVTFFDNRPRGDFDDIFDDLAARARERFS